MFHIRRCILAQWTQYSCCFLQYVCCEYRICFIGSYAITLYSTTQHWSSSIIETPNRQRKTRLLSVYFNVWIIWSKTIDFKMVEYFRTGQLLLYVHMYCTFRYAIYYIVFVCNWSFCIRKISQFYHDIVAFICDLYWYEYTYEFFILFCNRGPWKSNLTNWCLTCRNIFEKKIMGFREHQFLHWNTWVLSFSQTLDKVIPNIRRVLLNNYIVGSKFANDINN